MRNAYLCSALSSSFDNRREIALLTTQSTRLSSRINLAHHTRDVLNESVREKLVEVRRYEQYADRCVAEEQEEEIDSNQNGDERTVGGNSSSLPSLARLHHLTSHHNSSLNTTLLELEQTVRDVELAMRVGKIGNRNYSIATAASTQQQRFGTTPAAAASAAASAAELPSMLLDSADSHHGTFQHMNGGGVIVAHAPSSAITAAAATATSSDPSSSSPFLIHQSNFQSQYLSLDARWARTLNNLYRTLFGGASGSDSAGGGGVHSKALLIDSSRESETALRERDEIEAVIQATPHAVRTMSRMRMGMSTVERGRIGVTPMKSNMNSASAQSLPPPFNSIPSSSTSSSLPPSLHVHFSSELTRLYDTFPSSQDYWLYHNLLYISLKTRIEEQHTQMVKEESYAAMSLKEVNEACAELSLLVTQETKQLNSMLNDESQGGFAQIWHDLRSLQLLELLRADLSFAFERQHAYLEEQQKVQHLLLEQKSRHELLLGAWRCELVRLEKVNELLVQLEKELAEEARTMQQRCDSMRATSSLHDSTRQIHATDRISLDQRSRFLQRVRKMAVNTKEAMKVGVDEELWKVPGAKEVMNGDENAASNNGDGVSPSTSTSFSSLFSLTTLLCSSPSLLESQRTQSLSARSELMHQLESQAKLAREMMMDDGEHDITLTKAGTDQQSIIEHNLSRLNSHPFVQLHLSTSRAIDRIGDALNLLTQHTTAQRALIASGQLDTTSSSSSASSMDPSKLGVHTKESDLATRSVWTEFIQAPNALDERIEKLKKKLESYETR